MKINHGIYGAEARKEIRKCRLLRVQSVTNSIFEEVMKVEDLEQSQIESEVLARMEQIRDRLKQVFGFNKDRAISFKYAVSRATNDYKTLSRKISNIFDHSEYEGLSTVHEYDWWCDTKKGLEIYRMWVKELNIFLVSSKSHEIRDILFHLSMSAIFCGAIGNETWIRSLLSNILDTPKKLIKVQIRDVFQYWLELQTTDPSLPRNARDQNGEVTTRLWRIDGVSLILLLSALTKFGTESRINCLSAGEILLLINKWVQERLGHSLTIKKLCKIGVSVLETRNFMPVAKPMVKTVMCGYPSGSITLNDLSSIVRDNCVDTASIEVIDDYCRSEVRKRVRYFDDLDSLDKVFLSALLKILQTSDALLEDLGKLSSESTVSARKALVDWYYYLLNERALKTSSVATYHSAIAQRWLVSCGFTRLEKCDEYRVNEIFEDLFEEIPVSDRHYDYVLERAQDLYRFLNNSYGWGFEMPRALTQRIGSPAFIRADVIPVWVVSEVVRYFLLKNTKVDAFLYKQLALIVIVAHRTGMRISEILKIRLVDVEDSAAYWVQVRESEFGGHKTASARRKIPMGALLTERELALFEDVFSIRKVLFRDSNPARVLLFSADGSATGLFDQGYVSKIVSTLMSNVYGRKLVFHSLRHTALTTLEIVFDGRFDDFARTLSGYSLNQLEIIRKRVRGQRKYDSYWQLSGLAGHISPKSTLENYLHATPMLFYLILADFDSHIQLGSVKRFLGISQSLVTRRIMIKDDHQFLSYVQICQIVEKMVDPFVELNVSLCSSNQQPAPSVVLNSSKDRTDILTCYRVLKDIEDGKTLSQASNNSYAPRERISVWVKSAQRVIASYRTVRGRSRLINDSRLTSGRLILTPSLPNSNLELAEAIEAVTAFRKVYSSDKDLLLWAIEYVLSRVSVENTGLRFSDPDDLARFLSILTLYFEPQRIRIKLHPLQNSDPANLISIWKQKAPGTITCIGTQYVKNRSIYPLGRVLMILRHPEEDLRVYTALRQGLNYEQYSSRSLLFMFHMLAIMLPGAGK